jgi:flagellin-specific chaperone FliS
MMRKPELAYQTQSVKIATPLELVVKLYDLVIQASYKQDEKKVKDILTTLMHGLDFDHEPAEQLFSLYQYCKELARKKQFEEIREVLGPLRDTWNQVANKTDV